MKFQLHEDYIKLTLTAIVPITIRHFWVKVPQLSMCLLESLGQPFKLTFHRLILKVERSDTDLWKYDYNKSKLFLDNSSFGTRFAAADYECLNDNGCRLQLIFALFYWITNHAAFSEQGGLRLCNWNSGLNRMQSIRETSKLKTTRTLDLSNY